MNLMPIFISHYTLDTEYENIVERLVDSLKKHRLDFDIEAIQTLGSWRANSNYCAKQVQQMLKKHYPRPVLRLDADAVVQRYPVLLESPEFYKTTDVAACIWKRFRKGGELLGGTMYFNNTSATQKLVDEWVVQSCDNKNTKKKRNPDLLELLLFKGFHMNRKQHKNLPCRFTMLPLEYCKIFDLMEKEVPAPIIEHFQASRKNKRKVDRMGKNVK
jgi:hypothetical protein